MHPWLGLRLRSLASAGRGASTAAAWTTVDNLLGIATVYSTRLLGCSLLYASKHKAGVMDGDPAVESQLDGFSLVLPLPYRVALIIVLGTPCST